MEHAPSQRSVNMIQDFEDVTESIRDMVARDVVDFGFG